MNKGNTPDHQAFLDNLQTFLDKELAHRETVRVLEAGSGSASRVNFGKKAHLVGIDISQKQLQRNEVLQEKIIGDIQQYDFRPGSFDFIVCWDVLEHLPQPKLALRRFAVATKTNGLVVLRLPNVLSIKGLVAKFTPHIFHIIVYRWFWNDKNAGKDDTWPFKTYLRFSIRCEAIKKLCAKEGLYPVYSETYDVTSSAWLRRKKLAFYVYLALKGVFNFLSFGCINDSDFVLVLQKSNRHTPVTSAE